ncbi:MAG: hypothetical protein KAG19_00180 [Methylococcales bacterium]|nr:hypothetical protein [Methylococcales bacterium]
MIINKTTQLKQQDGAVLAISLVMLLALTLMGLAGMHTTSLEEKMVSNVRDQYLAFQAAESALREAEIDIRESGRVSGLIGMNERCDNGLCYSGQNGLDKVWDDSDKVKNATVYGRYTSTPDIKGVIEQPRYLITGAKIKVAGGASIWKHAYQITAIANGGQATTVSMLNEIYVR